MRENSYMSGEIQRLWGKRFDTLEISQILRISEFVVYNDLYHEKKETDEYWDKVLTE